MRLLALVNMTVMVVERCGGHITLLFSIWKDSHLARLQGSRGAGFNISTGVEARVEFLSSNTPETQAKLSAGELLDIPAGPVNDGDLQIYIEDMNGRELENSSRLYVDLIDELRIARLLRPEDSYSIRIKLELPTSQGFGMSAAGLLAVTRCISSLTGKGTEQQYQRIAHRIERKHGSGLGDVLGMSKRGVELRFEPGAPGSGGIVEHFTTVQPVLVVWQHDESRHTSKYIDDDRWQRAISQAGERSVSRLKLKEWDFERWPDLMLESRNFAQESGLQEEPARKKLLSIVRKEILRLDLQARVNVRLCMLGISATILPRRLDSPLTESELGNISEALQNTGIGVVETRIH